jgi:hypothetical protein
VSIHADPLFVAAEVERRLESAGVRRDGRRHAAVPRSRAGTRLLAAVVARRAGGRAEPATGTATPLLDAGCPHHR